ncbi:hypothetical protein EDM27_16065, partial [Staphylococcus aureus]
AGVKRSGWLASMWLARLVMVYLLLGLAAAGMTSSRKRPRGQMASRRVLVGGSRSARVTSGVAEGLEVLGAAVLRRRREAVGMVGVNVAGAVGHGLSPVRVGCCRNDE